MRFEPSQLFLDVRPNDLDSLGHVNNAVALEYLEAGRWDWMDRHGIRRGGSVVPVVMRIELHYRREIRPQRLTVRTILQQPETEAFEDWTAYKVRFLQQVLTSDEADVAVEAEVDVAFIDGATRGLASLHDFLAASSNPGAL